MGNKCGVVIKTAFFEKERENAMLVGKVETNFCAFASVPMIKISHFVTHFVHCFSSFSLSNIATCIFFLRIGHAKLNAVTRASLPTSLFVHTDIKCFYVYKYIYIFFENGRGSLIHFFFYSVFFELYFSFLAGIFFYNVS